MSYLDNGETLEIVLFAALGFLVGILVNVVASKLIRERVPDWQGALPFRPLLVDLTSAAAFAALWTRHPSSGISPDLVLLALYTAVFLIVIVTDFERRFIFNVVILPAILVAALASPFTEVRAPRSLLGGALALVVFIAIYLFSKLFERLRGLSIRGGAFGQGDVTLATFIGLVTAFPSVVNALLLGIVLGGVGAVVTLGYHLAVNRRLAFNAVIPYGPFLCIAGWFYMVFR